MKKLFFSFAVVAGVVLAACNNKPAEEAATAAVDSAATAVTEVATEAAAVVESLAAVFVAAKSAAGAVAAPAVAEFAVGEPAQPLSAIPEYDAAAPFALRRWPEAVAALLLAASSAGQAVGP